MKKSDDEEEVETTRQRCKRLAMGCGSCLKVLEIYFFATAALYLTNAMLCMIMGAQTQAILCKIPGEYNTSLGHTVGCGNCTDSLLMCDKQLKTGGWCYKAAMNITVKKVTSGKKKSWKEPYEDASLDTVCNEKIVESNDPVQMLSVVLLARQTTPTVPSDPCVTWHCYVMLTAVNHKDLSDESGVCTNTEGAKPSHLVSSCPCNGVLITPTIANNLNNACGPDAASLKTRVFRTAKGLKNDCLKESLTAAQAKVANAYSQTEKIADCATWLQSSNTHWDWFNSYDQYVNGGQRLPAGITAASFASCVTTFCVAFAEALGPSLSATCTWNTTDYIPLSTASAAKAVVICADKPHTVPSLTTVANIKAIVCDKNKQYLADWATAAGLPSTTNWTSPPLAYICTELTTTAAAGTTATTATTTADPASSRRLSDEEELKEAVKSHTGPENCDGAAQTVDTPSSGQRLRLEDLYGGVPEMETDAQWQTPSPASSSNMVRLLQDAPAPSPPPAPDLPDWQVGDWSQCVCWQQCITGVKKRSVQCNAGSCKVPQPETKKKCLCTNCAACQVEMILMIFSLTLLVQGGCGLLLCLAFFWANSICEDDLAEVRCCSLYTPIGFLCKWFPLLSRLIVYVSMGQVLYLLLQAFVPFPMTYDCKANLPFQMLVAASALMWVTTITYGIYMRRYRPLPAQLFVARSSSKIMGKLCFPFRCIGP
jgi:hypothetical protein